MFLLRRRQDFDKQNFNQALLALKHKNTLKTADVSTADATKFWTLKFS